MNRKSLISGLFVVGLVFGFGCASADDASPESDTASDEVAQTEDVSTTEGELGTAEQSIILPIEEPGPAVPCVAACQKISTTNIAGLCCVCNGSAKTFRRHPAIPSLYVCM